MAPTLSLLVNDVALSGNDSINFGNATQISITCTAVNSRPSVTLQILDPTTSVPLPLVASTLADPNPVTFCDSSSNCNAILRATLTPGFASVYNLKRVGCLAFNNTSPFNLTTSISFPLNFSGTFRVFYYIIWMKYVSIISVLLGDPCLNNLCQNGSTCNAGSFSTQPFGYYCTCRAGLAGPFCNYSEAN